MKVITFCILSCLLAFSLQAQNSEAKVYSVFIYNFGRLIQWPPNKTTGDFIIGVIGETPVSRELVAASATKKIGNQKVVVKEFQSLDEMGANDFHLIFVPLSKSSSVHTIASKFGISPTLIITEQQGMVQKGAAISFTKTDGKLRFELNKKGIEEKGMKIAAGLSDLAIIKSSD